MNTAERGYNFFDAGLRGVNGGWFWPPHFHICKAPNKRSGLYFGHRSFLSWVITYPQNFWSRKSMTTSEQHMLASSYCHHQRLSDERPLTASYTSVLSISRHHTLLKVCEQWGSSIQQSRKTSTSTSPSLHFGLCIPPPP